MPYYKDTTNKVHFIESADFAYLLPSGSMEITQAEAEALTAPPPSLYQIKADLWGHIKAERDRRTQTGGYPAAGKWFHSDTFSRTQILALVMLGANIPAGLQWKTMDGSFIPMTSALAYQVFASAAIQDTLTFQAAETHKAAMEASVDPAAMITQPAGR